MSVTNGQDSVTGEKVNDNHHYELADLSEDDLDMVDDIGAEHVKTYCIINGNGYNVIKNALTTARPTWREIKKEELWNRMQHPKI